MSHLVLELRQGEMMVVNGAPIRFRTKSRIELTAHARFLFGKQLMAAEDANSPARRIYLALQRAYVGMETERQEGLLTARTLAEAFKAASDLPVVHDMLDEAIAAASADECYAALKLARQVIRHEDAVLRPTASIIAHRA